MRRLYFVLAMLLYSASAWALTPNQWQACQIPNRGILSFGLTGSCTASGVPYTCCTGNGAGCTPGTYSTLYTAAAGGSKCNALWVDNNDPSAAHNVNCVIVNNSNKYGGFAATTNTAGAATLFVQQNLLPVTTAGIPPAEALDNNQNPFIFLNNGDTLQCTWATNITSGDQIDLHADCCDFQ